MADLNIYYFRSAKITSVHLESSGTITFNIRYTNIAILEQRVPNPDIKCIVVAKTYSCYGIAYESATHDRRFSEADTMFEAAFDPKANIGKSVISILVCRIEIAGTSIPRLV